MNYDLSVKFGIKLRDARKDRALTQAQLANKAGVKRATVIRAEAGANVGIDDLHKIAQAMRLQLNLSDAPWPTWENAAAHFLDEGDD